MANLILFTIKEANLLRKRMRHLMDLRFDLLDHPSKNTVHDLRVASRRVREVLDYFEEALPQNWYEKIKRPTRRITKSLGTLREMEVNLILVKRFHEEQRLNPFASELLIHSLRRQLQRCHQKALKEIRSTKFSVYEKFVRRIKGSRSRLPASASVLSKRIEDFWNYPLDGEVTDEQLHELRIRTKKFRYAVEIFDRVHHRNMGRFLRRIRNLQEVLGSIHDLFVFETLLRQEIDTWNEQDLTLIPATLAEADVQVRKEKHRLYPRVKPLYTRIVENAPQEILSTSPITAPLVANEHKPQDVAGEMPEHQTVSAS
jgi:CHAD domain-containing protein